MNEILDYIQKKRVKKSLMQKIMDCMEDELNRRYTPAKLDFYNFDERAVDNNDKLSLKDFLETHPKTVFLFSRTYALPELYEKQITPDNLIGEGGFGKVYQVQDEEKNDYALKKLIEVSCQDFSKIFKEMSFNFMFDPEHQPRIYLP